MQKQLARLAALFGVAATATAIAAVPANAVGHAKNSAAVAQVAGSLSIIAGINAPIQSGVSATTTPIAAQAVAVDASGNLYIADSVNNVVEKVTPSGTLSIIAGTGMAGKPTPGPATKSDLNDPTGVAVDSSGNVYIVDYGNSTIEKVTTDGTLSIIAGASHCSTTTWGSSACTNTPVAIAVSSATGDIYIAADNQVIKIAPSVGQSVVAGTGTFGKPSPGPATSSDLDGPSGLAVDSSGNLYIADSSNEVVEKVTPSGTLSIVAGTGAAGKPTAGSATKSELSDPTGVAIDSSGNLYIADAHNNVVEEVTPSGTLSIFAGDGFDATPTNGPAASSSLGDLSGLAVDSSGTVYIADAPNFVVEKVTSAGALSVVAGTNPFGRSTPGPATSSHLASPTGVAVDSAGDVYIADANNNEIEKVTPSGTLSIIAGTGTYGKPTPGPATESDLFLPIGLAVDSSGNVYIADTGNNEVEKVTPSGTLSIIAGTGTRGEPTPGPAANSQLNAPEGVAVDSSGNVYIADSLNNLVEKVTPSGTLSIIDGDVMSTPGPGDEPAGLAVDSSGNVYIGYYGDGEVEKLTPSGTLSIIAGTGAVGKPTPGPATSSALSYPVGVAVDSSGNVYIADSGDNEIDKVTPSGTLSIVAGTGNAGRPTPGPAVSSDLYTPTGVAVDAAGTFYIADGSNDDVEEVTATDYTTTAVGCSPSSGVAGSSLSCVATVTDLGATPTVPTGPVTFNSVPTTGKFANSGSCTLTAASAAVASCSVSFTPSAAGDYVVTGTYGGDRDHLTSSGSSATIAVSQQPVTTTTTTSTTTTSTTTTGGYTPPTVAQVRRALAPTLVPRGKPAKIENLLKANGFATTFMAPSAGTLTIVWRATVVKNHRRTTITIATGTLIASGAGHKAVKIKLTTAGRNELKTVRSLKLTATASFTPAQSSKTTESATFTATR